MPYAHAGEDVRLFYTDDGAGEGPPLLLVHGWGADSHQWSWHLDALARRRRVIAADLRGHGYSSVPPEGNTPRRMAADLAALLDALGIDRVAAVGHSMGGQVVSILAVEHPGLVERLVAVDPGYGMAPELAGMLQETVTALRSERAHEAAVELDRWCTNRRTPPVIRRWHRRRLSGMPPHVLAQAFEAMFVLPEAIGVRPASDAYLARRRCPVLALWHDPAQAAWESGLLEHPDSAVVVWEGASHRLHEERPEEFTELLLGWL
ncbi:alpha/beta fold hydrolase [Nonomuraea typhae]|uniref:Alpha/beta fold hydrolase n=1 Tax=Nonomuraea typhae TaxID=2603600 RepID=A0ABW7YQW1_9ACTN